MIFIYLALNILMIGLIIYVVIKSSKLGATIYKSTQSKGWLIFWIMISLVNFILLIINMSIKMPEYEFFNRTFWIIYGIYFGFFVKRNIEVKEKGIIIFANFIKWEDIDNLYFEEKGLKIKVKGKLKEFDYKFIENEKEQVLQCVKQYTKKDTLS